VHHTLLSLIAPRPIAFASTIDREGRINLSPFSYFNVFGINPPILIFSPARSVRTLAHKDTTLNVQEVPEVVINLVDRSIVEQASLASSPYPRGVNEFQKSGLEMVASDLIAPPRVAEAPASFECLVDQIMPLGDGGGSGNLIICRVVRMHVRNDLLNPENRVNLEALHMVGRMGGNYYVEAAGAALFEIEKPNEKIGVGVDSLPEALRTSPFLTGAQLARMGNLNQIPTLDDIDEAELSLVVHAINEKEYPAEAPSWLKGVEFLLEKGRSKEAWQWYLRHQN
jgi:flavin reductase (DIM6/NTAB) family NADH-FMN oxidoreductase RutF